MLKQAGLNHSSIFRIVIISIVSLCYLNLPAQAPLTKLINFEVTNTPIAEALIELSETADINIAFHPRLFKKEEKVSGTFQQKKH